MTVQWWSPQRREEFQKFRESLRAQLRRNGLEPPEAMSRLRADFPVDRSDDIDLNPLRRELLLDWFDHGGWDPVVLYAFCERYGYNQWEAAVAIRALPEDPSVWLGERMRAGTLLSVERYLDDKYRNQVKARNDARQDPAERTMRQIENLLSKEDVRARIGSYRLSRQRHDRGVRGPVPYHDYILFEPVTDGGDSRACGEDQRIALCHEVDRELEKLRRDRIYVHWEPSRELIAGSPGCQALIVESYYDNKPSRIEGEAELRRWADVTPVVLLGVYYSGTKDVAVELARSTRLGALDVSRYVAEEIRDTRPFRRELILQSQVFWNLVTAEIGGRLVVTLDDYHALVPRADDPNRDSLGWPIQRDWRPPFRPRKYPGTAVLLQMDAKLLEYAAYRVVQARISNRDILPPGHDELRSLVQNERRELIAAQDRLGQLADRFEQRYKLRPLTMSEAGIRPVDAQADTSDGYGYRDQVHEMFDAYRRMADTVVDELDRRINGEARPRRAR